MELVVDFFVLFEELFEMNFSGFFSGGVGVELLFFELFVVEILEVELVVIEGCFVNYFVIFFF